jgi:hypothetical protein
MPEEISAEFANADLKDARRTRRLGEVAKALGEAPGLSIPAACGGWAETMAAYRLFNCEAVKPAAIIAPHHETTAARCEAHPCVVVAQDTTEFDYTHMKGTTGFGPLNGLDRRGCFLHSLYVVTEEGLPLGLLDTAILMRDDETFGTAASRKKLPIEEKESVRWLDGYLRTLALARRLPQCEVFSISDREGDIHEVFEAWRDAGEGPRAEWIIRANQDRALAGVAAGEPGKLFAALEAAPELGTIEFEIKASTGTKKVKGNRVPTSRSARTVKQTIRVLEITPRPPARAGGKPAPVSFWAVLAEETDPPAGEEPVRWLLLTSKKVTTLEEARRIIRLYLRRWDIEVFHRVVKTGCRVERIQLTTAAAVLNALMVHLVVAWRILYLTHLGRRCPGLPCGCVFDEAEWRAACVAVKRPAAAGEPTLAEFIGIVGKLGGHLGRKCDGPPGPQSMWQGLARVRDFAIVWLALKNE